MKTPSSIISSALINFLGCSSIDQRLEDFLEEYNIHDRPMTVEELELLEDADDKEDTDAEYELNQKSKDSLIIGSERNGFCLIFKKREDYELTHSEQITFSDPFVLEQIAFFANGVQTYQGFQGSFLSGITMETKKNDPAYTFFGDPIASRIIYDTPVELFHIYDLIVNFGFMGKGSSCLAHVHIRKKNIHDKVMLKPNFDTAAASFPDMIGSIHLGKAYDAPEVLDFFSKHGLHQSIDDYDCPEEFSSLSRSQGIIIYLKKMNDGSKNSSKNAISAITYKRRGDLGSFGYEGLLPFRLSFGESPDVVMRKMAIPFDRRADSETLFSLYWRLPSNIIIQAVFSLIDWQLARITLHAQENIKSVLPDNSSKS